MIKGTSQRWRIGSTLVPRLSLSLFQLCGRGDSSGGDGYGGDVDDNNDDDDDDDDR